MKRAAQSSVSGSLMVSSLLLSPPSTKQTLSSSPSSSRRSPPAQLLYKTTPVLQHACSNWLLSSRRRKNIFDWIKSTSIIPQGRALFLLVLYRSDRAECKFINVTFTPVWRNTGRTKQMVSFIITLKDKTTF